MTRGPHPLDRSGSDHHGPLDLRPIEADDIGAAHAQAVDLIRGVKAAAGHRAAATAALAALGGVTEALVELGSGEAALNTLRKVAADLEARRVPPAAAARPVVLH